MKKLYTEDQYNFYSDFLDRIANEDDLVKNMDIYLEMKDWISVQKISQTAINQMDNRIEDEDTGNIPKLKRIK